jgi:hypothetical protein
MSEVISSEDQINLTPRRIAFIVDNKVVDILQTDERLGAIFLSQPEIINITDVEERSFPSVDWKYETSLEKFIPPKPFASWIFDNEQMQWSAPSPFPPGDPDSGTYYIWDEDTTSWILSQPE